MEFTYSLAHIPAAAETFWSSVPGARVIAFHGNMGAGKTTFIQALCRVLDVKDIISSPTFSIINEYSFTKESVQRKIYHIDLYRLQDEQEAIRAGVEDCLYSDAICLVEWPERIPTVLPAETLHVFIKPIDAQTRSLRIGDN